MLYIRQSLTVLRLNFNFYTEGGGMWPFRSSKRSKFFRHLQKQSGLLGPFRTSATVEHVHAATKTQTWKFDKHLLQPVFWYLFKKVCKQGYGLLFESSLTFLMLCWTQTLCWSSSCSLKARSSSSALRSISLSAISLVLQPGPTPLKHKNQMHFIVH